nr:uncharacterized protein LOC111503229 [Leptinotarsa decemlineata]
MNTIDSDDFTAEDIVELIPSMSNGLIKNYREFESRIANSETNCQKYHSIIKGYINFIGNFPSVLRKNVDQLELNLSRNKGILKEKKAEVEDLLKIEKELVESEHQNEQKIESLREKISHSREKIKNLEEKRCV